MNARLAAPPNPGTQRFRVPIGFLIVALLFFAIDGTIARSSMFLERPGLFTAAISFDLTIGVTFAYWLIVVRNRRAPARTLIAVFVLCVGGAALTLPPGHRELVRAARLLAVPFELALIVAIAIGVRTAHRRLTAAGVELDVPERIRAVLTTSLLVPRIADLLATEMSVLYFALAAWRRKPFTPTGGRAFSSHKRSGHAGILYAIALMSLVEVFVVDLVVRVHAPKIANGLLVVGVAGAMWIVGLARAIQLRPTFIARDFVGLRNGLRHSLDVPRASIATIELGHDAAPATNMPGCFQVGRGTPNVTLTFLEPIAVHRAHGAAKPVNRAAFTLDDPSGFRTELGL